VLNVYSLILAGGSGKRLWPISRAKLPKQMIVFDGEKTLLEKTIDRFSKIIPRERRWIVTTDAYAQDIKTVCNDLVETIIIEPIACNTAPALLLSCLELYQKNPDALVVVTPSDHVISSEDRFLASIQSACEYAQIHDALVVVGVRPREPLPCYGYIEINNEHQALVDTSTVYPVVMFHEKPSIELAHWYIGMPTMLWNCGIICARVSVILEEFKIHAPVLFDAVSGGHEPVAESIDDALLEKSQKLFAVFGDFDWSDVGSLETFIAASRSVHMKKNHVDLMGARNNIVYSNKTVLCASVQDICVIDTDDVLLIMPRNTHQQTFDIVDALINRGLQEYI